MSLMLKHQRRAKETGVVASVPPAGGPVGAVPGGRVGTQQLGALIDAALTEDIKSLKGVRSIERKIELKREQLIPKYREYVARLRSDGVAHPLLTQYLVWRFDVGELEAALDLGFHCLDHGVSLPERFRRDVPTYMADAVLEWAEAQFEAGRSPEPYFTHLFEYVRGDAVEPWDLPDALRAKYFRLHGLLKEQTGDLRSAEASLVRAMTLGAKVKTALAKVRKKAETAGD